ncbi:MAG: toll/interleukin-1 receptor domain-containing protein [Acidimicrobiales bacterium]
MTEGAEVGRRSKGVFISYRRGETSGQARALHELLSQRFGASRVFMDVDSISPGADFVEKIEEAIHSSGVALILIGRDWLSRGSQEHLLDDPSDFIRLETDTALRLGVPVIPILVERAPMPSPEQLPESLRPLARRNALELENTRWEYDAGRLVRAVEQLVDPTAGPKPEPQGREAGQETAAKATDKPGRSRRVLLVGLGAIVVVVALVVFVLLPSGPSSVSAAHAVAAVSPDRLAGLVLENRLGASEVPNDMSPYSPVLSPVVTHGLVANVLVPVLGPATYLAVRYLVFNSSGAASSFYTDTVPVPDGYSFTGTFAVSGFTDPTRCATGGAGASAPSDATRDSSCAVLSANVGVSLSSLRRYQYGTNTPSGLVGGSYVHIALNGNGHQDSVYFYVFGNPRQAQAFYTGLGPQDYHSTGLIDSSGFSQPANCHTFTNSSPTSPSGTYVSGCGVRWGDVVVYSEAGPSENVTEDAGPVAVALARMAVIELDRLDSN